MFIRLFSRALLIALFLARTSTRAGEPAEARIAAIEARMGGRIGVAALDSGSGRRVAHRSHEHFPMCSTFKFLAAAAVLHRVDEKRDQLTRFVPYTAADLLEYAPVTKQHVHEGGMTLGALCDAALTLSDNTAGNLLLQAIGGPEGLTRYARTLGDDKTRLDRMEPDLNSALPGDERDTTTPAAMLGNLRALLLGDALSAPSRQQLDTWLANNQTGAAMIRAGLPNDWKVGDKTGRGANGAANDVAIIRPRNRAPILLAIYSVGSSAPSPERLAALAEVAKVVAETFQQ
ncbi:MAG TPA: class A beta-lactamase [Chthoniobacterales bacterium]|jgi:beta-lactamase class A|nr:class A beta-lactamase [Chthoniobacterales bacterium]